MSLAKLQEPFPAADIEWRVQRSGQSNGRPWAMVLAYINARAVMDRLDEVCGPEGWKDAYEHIEGGVMCRLSLKIKDEWISKENGAPETHVEAFKGGISKAFVRAGVNWGIGRYLYKLEATFANFVPKSPEAHQVKIDGQDFFWMPPPLPDWALPEFTQTAKAPTPPPAPTPQPPQPARVASATTLSPVRAPRTSAISGNSPLPQDHNKLGSLPVTFGKFKGKPIKDIKLTEGRAYVKYLKEESKKKGEVPSTSILVFEEAIEKYWAGGETHDATDNIPF